MQLTEVCIRRVATVMFVALALMGFAPRIHSQSIDTPRLNSQQLDSKHLYFTENQGQWPESVLYRTSAGGATVWFTSNSALYQFSRATNEVADECGRESLDSGCRGSRIESIMIRASFEGSNREASVEGCNLTGYKCNYFIGNEPTRWRTDVANFGSITYKNIYDGIDLTYYGTGQSIEYDFAVAPGADFSKIRVSYGGARSVDVDSSGNLVIETEWGTVTEKAPVVYQYDGVQRRLIKGHYCVMGNNSFGFRMGAEYDAALATVIDPVITFSTYLGGPNYEQGLGIAADAAGSAYVCGTAGASFPTVNPLPYPGGSAFVTKISPDGSSLIYSTYIGGTVDPFGLPQDERATGISVDAAGCAYITGLTWHIDFPTVSAFDNTLNGLQSNAFVAKLSSSGSSLEYSTYLGGDSTQEARSIAVDPSGRAYVAGWTSSTNFPTANAYDATFNGNRDCFLTVFSPTGTSLEYSTFFGGTGRDEGNAIAVNATGEAFVAGLSYSSDFPTANAFDATLTGTNDVVAFKLSPSGSLVYSTFLGGTEWSFEYGHGIAVDAVGCAYVTDQTSSPDYPTVSAFDGSQYGSGANAFVSKLAVTGQSLVYSTYLGGLGWGTGIAVDGLGQAYVAGLTILGPFPAVNWFSGVSLGSGEAFIAELASSGTSLVMGGTIGGSESDQASSIALDASANLYATGWTTSTDFPTVSPLDNTFGTISSDAFVLKIGQPRDTDGDGVVDNSDNCPITVNADQADANSDGVGDACQSTAVLTPAGSAITSSPSTEVSVTFDNTTSSGVTEVSSSPTGPTAPGGFQLIPISSPVYYDLVTTANHSGPMTVCITYDPDAIGVPETDLRLLHYSGNPPAWADVTSSTDVEANKICGQVSTLSPFVLAKSLSCCHNLTGNVDCDPTDGTDISDLAALIDYLYITFTPLCCKQEANADGSLDGNIDISDLSALIDYLYISFTPPSACQ